MLTISGPYTTGCEIPQPSIQQAWNLLLATFSTPNEAHDNNRSVNPNTFNTLVQGGRSRDFDNMVHPNTASQSLRDGTPFGGFSVVDDVVRAQLSQNAGLLVRARCGYDSGAHSLRELHREETHSASALRQDPVPGSDLLAQQAKQRIPCRDASAAQGCGLGEGQDIGHRDEALLGECANGAERAIQSRAQARIQCLRSHRSGKKPLVDNGDHLITRLESSHMLTNGEDSSSAIGAGDNVWLNYPGIFSLGDENITKLELLSAH